MSKKTNEQILEEMRVYRETTPPLPDADARRIVQKWIKSDEGITAQMLESALKSDSDKK